MSGSRGAKVDRRYPYGRGVRLTDVLDRSITRKLPHIPPIPQCPIDRDKYKNHELLDMAKKYRAEERRKASSRWNKYKSASKESKPPSAQERAAPSTPAKATLPKTWERNITKKVSSLVKNKQQAELLASMMSEVQAEYVACMIDLDLVQRVQTEKKKVVRAVEPKSEDIVKLESLLSLVTAVCRKNVKSAQSALKVKLQTFHPCVQNVYQCCLKHLRCSEALIDLNAISFQEAVSMRHLQDSFNQACEAMEYRLLNRWWKPVREEISDMWYSKSPRTVRVRKTVLQTSAALISLELRTAKENMILFLLNETVMSSSDFTKFKSTKLRIDVKLLGREVAYTPSEEHIVQTWFGLIRRLDESLSNLFDQFGHIEVIKGVSLKIHSDILNRIEFEVSSVISNQKELLEEWANNYVKDYLFIVQGDAEDQVSQFLKIDNTFETLETELLRYQLILEKLREKCNGDNFLILYADVSQLKRGLIEILEHLIRRILDAMYHYHVKTNSGLCDEFYQLKEEIQNSPRNTEELLKMNVLLDSICSKKLPELTLEVNECGVRMMKLLDSYHFLAEDVELNAEVLSLPANIQPSLEACSSMLDNSKWNLEDQMATEIDFVVKEVDRLSKQVKDFNDYGDITLLRQYSMEAKLFHKRVLKVFSAISWINREETLFKIPVSSYPDADTVSQELQPYLQLYSAIHNWQRVEKNWLDGSFLDMKSDQIESRVELFSEQAYELQKAFRGKFKNLLTGGNRRALNSTKTEVVPVTLANLPAPLKLCEFLTSGIVTFKENLQAIAILCNPGLKTRHWHEMAEELGVGDIVPNTGTTLRRMLELPISLHMQKLETIAAVASKEYSLEQALVKMKQEWDAITIPLLLYKDKETSILASIEEIQNLLDDHVIRTQTMRGSPFSKPIEKNIKDWEVILNLLQDTLDSWLSVQSQWLYLEPVFSSEDIMVQIPIEGKLFKQIDVEWKTAMSETAQSPKVLSIVKTSYFLDTFRRILENLEVVSKGLSCYLEQKRLLFPRFFFLSNDEMLEILSETQDPKRVQPHLKKCFEGIAELDFTRKLEIEAMISSEGEKVKFIRKVDTVKANGQLEKWLCDVQDVMKASVHKSIVDGIKAYSDETRGKWATQWPGQVVLCVSQIKWTSSVHKALRSGDKNDLVKYGKMQEKHLAVVVDFVRSELPPLVRKTMGALIVLDVHSRDVVNTLIGKAVVGVDDFNWTSQLRYYWQRKDVLVRMIYTEALYAYEYLGNSDRLVMTPLTDRCYRTLMAAYHLHLNGAPEGPAGTGKTETTKDLAKALAVQCVVFNCSEGLDYLAMGKFFKGLASSGAWACFDEFNRIELEVLSVVAQQIQSISQAIQAKKVEFEFEGTSITLNPTCYVCITMNPHYAGRSELPDNLKVLFRTVAMMVPDYGMIAEILLYSYGFLAARPLSEKLVVVFKLASEQLSPQWHYDYGMRALKAVLAVAGQLKLLYSHEPEESLLLKAVIDVNTPKFLSHDIPLFHGILQDLFPNMKQTQTDEELFFETAKEVCQNLNLQPGDSFLEKLSQTFSVMTGRHGFMLVGAPDSGKSTIIKVLAETLSKLDNHAVLKEVLNPKTLNLAQLFGQFDSVSREWNDGLVALVFRKFATSNTPQRKWIIFDGPVDTLWAESMNTVLDDNKKLCLMSGETIPLSSTMSLIFEVTDLSGASPATVSRCGMVYIEPEMLGWRPLVTSWLTTVPEKWRLSELLTNLSEWLIPTALDFQRQNCKEWVHIGDQSLVRCLLDIVTMVMEKGSSRSSDNSDMRFIRTWVMGAFAFAITWSIGGVLDGKSREKFSYFLKELLIGCCKETPLPDSIAKFDCPFPIEGLIYDYNFECRGRSQWVPWTESLHPLDDDSVDIREVIVPTVDTVRYSILMDLFIYNSKPLLLVGPTGTGKSVYTKDKLLKGLPKSTYLPIILNFCAHTTAPQVQEIIMSKLEKRKKGVYGPPIGQKCIIFVDDLNMPQAETYGAHPPLELLRQLLDHGYWFDRKDLSKIHLKDVQLISVMGPPGGARSQFTPRLLRHFSVLSVNPFSEETLTRIFTTLMNIHLRAETFPVDMFSAVGTIVRATLDIYQSALSHLLPTPSKSHYIFNLRDFARVIHGCCLIKRESVPNRRVFVRLWVHEVLRVFYDRLEDSVDRTWLFTMMKDRVKTHFKESFELVFAQQAEFGKVTEESMQNLIFGTFMNPDATLEDRIYEEVVDLKLYDSIVRNALTDYNSIHKTPMNLVIFRYVLEHVSRICRILATPGGHALLVGVGGSGRQSCARLASFIAGYTVYQPEATKSYTFLDWREDLKKVLKSAGAFGKHVVLLITESQIREERFLEDLDSLLNSGEIANLYAVDERQEIIEAVQTCMTQQTELSLLEIFALFVRRCKSNLHIIIAFSPIGTTFYRRLRQYPSLVNCCTIDWFLPWPPDALEKVATYYMEEVAIPYQIKPAVVKLCRHFHTSVYQLSEQFLDEQNRATYVTASSYLELLGCYRDLLASQQTKLQEARKRYQGGLEKLANAAKQVERMQQELEELQPRLVVAATEAEEMIVTIEKESKEAEIKRHKVREDEVLANKQADEAQELKNECETDLAAALPALEAAVSALDTLKPSDITLVKSMKNPPKAIKIVMAAVCVMKGVKADRITDPNGKKVWDFWAPSKKLLGDLSFLSQLKEYDKDNVANSIMDTIRKYYLTLPEFKPKIVAKASTAAEGLCKWVLAIEFYDKVAKEVAPKREKLASAESQLEETMSALATKQEELRLVEEHVRALEQKFQEMSERKRELEVQVEVCSRKLERACKLLGGLAGERTRWSLEADRLTALYTNLPGDVLLASGMIAYLGPYNVAYRRNCLTDWHHRCMHDQIPTSKDFQIRYILGDPEEIQHWFQQGLPSDSFSVDNAIIIHNSRRWPLLIDPENQANKWIKKCAGSELRVVKLTDQDFIVNLKMCLQLGIPLLIEGLGEELDPRLDPVLSKHTFKQAGLDMLQLGDFAIEYSQAFRLYMTTKLRNPHYLPETATKVSLLNFTITPDGLDDQLLGIVVSEERPDLEEARCSLIERIAEHKRSLKEIEDKILLTLASSQGNLLEDETAIQILDHSKALATDVAEKQEVAEQTEIKIQASRQKYNLVAVHSSKLFFCLTNLPNVDPMYQYSLSWFIGLYINCIRNSPKSEDLRKRLDLLIDHFTYSLFSSVSRSLLEKHKLLFSFLLCCNLELGNEVNEDEFKFLLNGGIGVKSDLVPNPTNWLSKNNWEQLCCLNQLPSFEGICDSFCTDADKWVLDIPQPWSDKLNDFQKLLIYRCIRLNQISYFVKQYVAKRMGRRYIEHPTFNIKNSFNDSSCRNPLIFILSPGSDPISAIQQFSRVQNIKLRSVSLGQGQGPNAERNINEAQIDGNWVVLQNCHLALSWMPSLEKLCENVPEDVNPNFRLWLTSYPSDKFPIPILQDGVKITNESPPSLRDNLYRSFSKAFDASVSETVTKLTFSFCLFHAVVQERCQYGPIGWNVSYTFDESDLQITLMQLKTFLSSNKVVPFQALTYLIGECNYGGRVTDDWDRLCLQTILKDFCNAELLNTDCYMFLENEIYHIPKGNYLDYIKELPENSGPGILGMHDNVEVQRELMCSQQLLDNLLLTQITTAGNTGLQKEESLLNNIILDLLSKLPSELPVIDKDIKFGLILRQETERYNGLLKTIKSSLIHLERALEGKELMTSETERMGCNLIMGRIPQMWLKHSYLTRKPLASYITDLGQRVLFFRTWSETLKTPCPFWLPGFFFPQAFLTSGLQYHTRHVSTSSMPIDKLAYDFKVMAENDNLAVEEGFCVNGLFLEGARWDSEINSLIEQSPGHLWEELPPLWLKPALMDDIETNNRYNCPLYRTSERRGSISTTGHSSNFILSVYLPTHKHSSHWIKRGTALLCQIDD